MREILKNLFWLLIMTIGLVTLAFGIHRIQFPTQEAIAILGNRDAWKYGMGIGMLGLNAMIVSIVMTIIWPRIQQEKRKEVKG